MTSDLHSITTFVGLYHNNFLVLRSPYTAFCFGHLSDSFLKKPEILQLAKVSPWVD